METYERHRDGFTVSTDPARLAIGVIHAFLARSYWSPGVPEEVVARAIQNSLCFGLYSEDSQIGFARFVTDYARHTYLCDLFVLQESRRQGLGRWLTECAVNCPLIAGVRTICLDTRDAHGLYEKLRFTSLVKASDHMVLKFGMPWFRPQLAGE